MIAAFVTINPGSVHTYTVTVRVDIDLAAAGGPDGDRLGTATGLRNVAGPRSVARTDQRLAGAPFSTLELHKRLMNDDGGNAEVDDFQLSAAGTVSFIGTDGVRRIAPAGDYALSETGLAGYTAGDWSCTGGNRQPPPPSRSTIPPTWSATIVNDDEPVDLQLTKSDGGAVATGGGPPFQYTITVTNVGPRDVDLDEPVTVTDGLPAGLVWVPPAPAGCTIAGQTLTCDIDPALLTIGAQPVEIVATTRARPASPVQRSSTGPGSPPTTIPCAVPNPAAGAVPGAGRQHRQRRPDQQRRLRINTDRPRPSDRDRQDRFGRRRDVGPPRRRVHLSIGGPQPRSVRFAAGRDGRRRPAGALKLVSAISEDAGWTRSATDPVVRTFADDLHAGESAPPIVVAVRVAAAAAGTSIGNVATAPGEVGPPRPTPGQGTCVVTDDDDETTPLVPVADLAITKSPQTAPVAPGSPVRWDLSIVNNGPGVAVKVIITDTVPAPPTVVGGTSSEASWTPNANPVHCTVASLPWWQRYSPHRYRGAGRPPAGRIRNVAKVTSDTPP